MEKISVEFGTSIVQEGGLTACLTYLDFFATSTQRTAVTTAANCCRDIPENCFPTIRDVMPILLCVLGSSDQKVVEQGCLCVSRIVQSFKYQPDKLEELISPDLLRAVLRLLLPGATNLIGQGIHTQFLRVLAITAKASPRLSVELLKMNVVDTLYQVLTGVSPPGETEDTSLKIDSVVIMQALIHRPRDQIFETLNVICELLPGLSGERSRLDSIADEYIPASIHASSNHQPLEKRRELLQDCKPQLKRFATILLPTLTDAYSSTVNLNVRQKVLTAQMKMLCNIDTQILEDALRAVPYASFLASILSQQDHPTLMMLALQAGELLLRRLESIYRYQFYREGVMSEISKLANAPLKEGIKSDLSLPSDSTVEAGINPDNDVTMAEANADDTSEDEENDRDAYDRDDDDEDRAEARDDATGSPSSSSDSEADYGLSASLPTLKDLITLRAKKFIDTHENSSDVAMRAKASQIMEDLQALAKEIEACYLHNGTGNGVDLFNRLATHFDGDALESITSSELLGSDIVRVLLDVFDPAHGPVADQACAEFLKIFMTKTSKGALRTTSSQSPSTPFSILVGKLQDLLSRSEHFEVMTVHQNSFDSNRSSAASMLAKQIRLKLTADDDSEIPRPYRNIMVSIHAIATFKALDDYLRPRISLAERPPRAHPRNRDMPQLGTPSAALAEALRRESRVRQAISNSTGANDSASSMQPPAAESSARPKKVKPKSRQSSNSQAIPPPNQETAKEAPYRPRRRGAKSSISTPPPPEEQADLNHTLECPDEHQVSDEGDEGDDATLNAIVDDLEDELDEDDEPDPTAVNMEIASTGKVTARKENSSRVATPSQAGTPTTKPSSSQTSNPPPPREPGLAGLSRRPLSYAAAIAAIPQDWHIEFSIDDQPVSNAATIYRAVHHNRNVTENLGGNVWSAIHTIKFKRASGPPPTEESSLTPSREMSESNAAGMPVSLEGNPVTSSILRLLKVLHGMNANTDNALASYKDEIVLRSEPEAQFINTKLTSKLNRQLEEPLIVASSCLPNWSEDLARQFPFLFPFETRHLFLQSTSFGYSRSMLRWQNAQSAEDERRHRHRDDRPFLGRLQRQKVRISRTKMLESAVKVMELYGASPSVLEVEYFEEVGTGLGPTLEFYSTVSKEFSKKKLRLWRDNNPDESSEYAFGKSGLFPAPMSAEQVNSENGGKILYLFKMLGKFVARSMLDSRIIDVSFNPTFFRVGENQSLLNLSGVRSVDSDLANSLSMVKQFADAKKAIDEDWRLTAAEKVEKTHNIELHGARVEDLYLDFTLPGFPSISLVPNGSNAPVTIDNVDQYLERVIDLTLGSGVQKQIEAFGQGFSQVFPYSALRSFTPQELVMLFGRVEEDWSMETLTDSIKADHGFNMDSKSVRNLLQTMSELTPLQRRDFLQFVTGSPKLPIGGNTHLPSPLLYDVDANPRDRIQDADANVHGGLPPKRATQRSG